MRSSLDSKFGILAEMKPSSGGVFEITLNGSLIFSKKQLGRFPNDGEIVNFIENAFLTNNNNANAEKAE